jgi:hypothetical protein
MAQDHSAQLRAVVLVAGYYTPSLRLDTFLLSPPAIPVIGTLMRYTISPVLGRLALPLCVRRVFAPASHRQCPEPAVAASLGSHHHVIAAVGEQFQLEHGTNLFRHVGFECARKLAMARA